MFVMTETAPTTEKCLMCGKSFVKDDFCMLYPPEGNSQESGIVHIVCVPDRTTEEWLQST